MIISKGERLICSKCNTKFFTLGRIDPECRKCGTKIVKIVKSKTRLKNKNVKEENSVDKLEVKKEEAGSDEEEFVDNENIEEGLNLETPVDIIEDDNEDDNEDDLSSLIKEEEKEIDS